MERRKRRRSIFARIGDRLKAASDWCKERAQSAWRATRQRLCPWKPVVLVDVKRLRAWRLRRMLSRAARMQCRALGVKPPEHLLIIVQCTVMDEERSVATLLEVFRDAEGVKRHVLFLALTVGREAMSDGDLVAMLRQQLLTVVADELGELVHPSVYELPRKRRPAPVVALPQREAATPPPFDEEAPFPDDADAPPMEHAG